MYVNPRLRIFNRFAFLRSLLRGHVVYYYAHLEKLRKKLKNNGGF